MKLLTTLILLLATVSGWSATFTGNFLGNPGVKYRWDALTNGVLAVPAFHGSEITGTWPGVHYYDTNGNELGFLAMWADHGQAANTPEFTWQCNQRIAIIPGYDGTGGGIQMNMNGGHKQETRFTHASDGNSSFVKWVTDGAIIGMWGQTNADGTTTLRLFNPAPDQPTGNSWAPTRPALVEWNTNNVSQRGVSIFKRATDTISASPYAFDFNNANCVDITVATSSAITFYATNATESLTNYEKRVFFIRSAGFSPAFTWPANWSVLGASAGGSLPASMSPIQIMKLEVESVGVGQSNKLATATLATDFSFVWDPDAQNFFGRVGVGILTLTQSNAVNNLVLNAKSHGWWTACDAIYPFVGGVSNAHAMNLRSNASHITWTATGVTHDALGVTGDGATGYGTTTNILSTAIEHYSQDSAHIFLYCGSNSVTATVRIMGATSGGNIRACIGATTTAWNRDGLNNNDNQSSVGLSTNDLRGPVLFTRTANNLETFYHGTRSGADGSASTGIPSQPFYILARNNGGSAENFAAMNLRGCMWGGAMSASDWSNIQSDWDSFNNALGRKVP